MKWLTVNGKEVGGVFGWLLGSIIALFTILWVGFMFLWVAILITAPIWIIVLIVWLLK